MSIATMTTNHGDITIELFDEDAPKTVENFKKLAADGFYDGLIVPPDHQGLHDPGRLPAGHRHRRPGLHVRGRDQLAQARARLAGDGQRRPEHQRLAVLHRHARRHPVAGRQAHVFGQVTDGMDVVDKLEGLPTGPGDRPREDAKIDKLTIEG